MTTVPTESAFPVMDGVLTIRKEAGWTSHDVVAKVRKILGAVKVGHAGTLDPAATGVLPVLIGRGTRIAEYLLGWDKEYVAVLRLGETTDTQDATGILLDRRPTEAVTADDIHKAVAGFQGTIRQMPPMYSAVKVDGVPLYRSARAGKTVDREPRTVTVHLLQVLAIEGQDVTLQVVCSKGTYIRTLCADLGSVLDVGGHLLQLERRRVGPLMIEQAMTVNDVAIAHAAGRLSDLMVPLDRALHGLPIIEVDGATSERVRHGAPIPLADLRRISLTDREARSGMPLRIHGEDGRLLAIGRCPRENSSAIAVEKVLVPQP
ncbi:MAG TPA: tRNA pseudouridine(55) synthase TruB [Nitrospira sp.]|nr:tRNA pseudouridine(55) synthase TruB [Nitrospira sp.]